MVEAWEIRGWSLKVREEPLSTGSSQNESCYLILLSTLLRFIRQLFDALQYAANRARIVCRRRSPFSALGYSFLSTFSFSLSVASASSTAYTHQTYVRTYLQFCVCTHNLATSSRLVTSCNFFTQVFFINIILLSQLCLQIKF